MSLPQELKVDVVEPAVSEVTSSKPDNTDNSSDSDTVKHGNPAHDVTNPGAVAKTNDKGYFNKKGKREKRKDVDPLRVIAVTTAPSAISDSPVKSPTTQKTSKDIDPLAGFSKLSLIRPSRILTDEGDEALPPSHSKNDRVTLVAPTRVSGNELETQGTHVADIEEAASNDGPDVPTADLVVDQAPDEEEVADRVARQVTTEVTERLQREFNPSRPANAVVAKEWKGGEDVYEDFLCGLRLRTWVVGLVVFFIVVVGIVLGVVLSNSDTAPTERPETVSPTTLPPTMNPRRLYILDALQSQIAPTEETRVLLDDPSTPQAQALHWLSEEDTFSADPEFLDSKILLERYVMAVLYFSSKGTSWIINFPFMNETLSVCDWNNGGPLKNENTKGAFCTELGNYKYVSYFRMHEMGMAGTLPWELSLLEYVISMYFEDNALRGTIPTELGILTGLQQLWAYGNALTGQIPGIWGSDVEELLFTNNYLSGTLPSELGDSASKLSDIRLAFNKLEGTLPSELGNLEYLAILDLESNQVSGTIPTEFGRLTNADQYYLEINSLTGTLPSEIGNLTLLRALGLSENKGLRGTVPEEYSNLTNLMILGLHDTALTGSLDSIFCPALAFVEVSADISADCLGTNPEIECSCCHGCCRADGTSCTMM